MVYGWIVVAVIFLFGPIIIGLILDEPWYLIFCIVFPLSVAFAVSDHLRDDALQHNKVYSSLTKQGYKIQSNNVEIGYYSDVNVNISKCDYRISYYKDSNTGKYILGQATNPVTPTKFNTTINQLVKECQ